MTNFSDPFEVLFSIQRALDARKASDWMGSSTTGMGSFPPINIFQQGDDFVAIVELPGVDKNDLGIDVKENTIRISGKKTINYDEGASVHRREGRLRPNAVCTDPDRSRRRQGRIPRWSARAIHPKSRKRQAPNH